MEIQKLIDALEMWKRVGVETVQVSDGYFGYEFNMRTRAVPNHSLPTELILRPINYRADADGVTRETSGVLQAAQSQS
jgi:hypothetical protein